MPYTHENRSSAYICFSVIKLPSILTIPLFGIALEHSFLSQLSYEKSPGWHCHKVKKRFMCDFYLEVWFLPLISYPRADSRLVPSQWEMPLQSNAISHWLGTNLEWALYPMWWSVSVVGSWWHVSWVEGTVWPLGPWLISQRVYELMVENCENLHSFSYDLNDPSRSQNCTCHDSSAVVTCAKLWPDQIIIFQVKLIWIMIS